MARKFITDEASPYYPPRARWFSAVFLFGNVIRRRLALDRLKMPRTMAMGELLTGFFLPGLAVYFRGPRLWGQAALAGSVMLLFIFVVWLGYPFANFAFGLLISIHSTGFVYYCNPLLATEPFRWRLAFTVLSLLAIGLLIYLPARHFVQNHCATPLRTNGRVVVVQRGFQPGHIQRGDWVAYSFDETAVGQNYHGGTVHLENGLSLAPVLALAGDTVAFSNHLFMVNGTWHTNLPHMPAAGGFTVAENHWFIWPNLGISGYGDVGKARIGSALLGLSNVPEENFYGKPFHRWFWRRQLLP